MTLSEVQQVLSDPVQRALGRLLHNQSSRQFWVLQAGGWLGLAVVSFFSLNLWYNQPGAAYVGHTFAQSVLGLLLSWPLRSIYRRVWMKKPAVRVAAIVSSVLVFSSAWALLRLLLFQFMTGEADLWADFGGWLFPSIFIFLCWTALYHGLKYYRLAELEHAALRTMEAEKDREAMKAAEARSSAREAELTMLRYQLNPHFLFNTLNAIQSLVASRRNEVAAQMISHLSDFLRYSLYTDSQSPVTVTEELLAVERYLDIERVRFGERLEVSVSMAPEVAGEYIPSMLLQPLVENAIKHAVAPSEDTALLTIEACRRGEFLELRVSDTGSGSEAARPIRDSGVGLRNIRQRLESAYGSAASLEHAYREQGGMTATVRIPTVVAAACA